MVPEGWKVTRLTELADVKRGAGSQYLTYVDSPEDGVRLIRISDFLGDSKKYILYTSAIDRFILKKEDILIAGTGATAGIIFRVPDEYAGLPFSYNAPRIRPKSTSCSGYLYYYLCSDHVIRQQHALFTGNAQPFLDTKAIGGFKVFAPPLPEQKKIAQILSTWDQAITATERLLENSQQRKKGLMQQLLTGKKRLPGFEGEWTTRELDSLGTTYPGLSGKTKEDFGSGEPFVTYMGVFSDGAIKPDGFGYVRLGEKESQNKVQYGDILLTTSSETPDEVGMASVLLERLSYSLYLNSFCFGFRANSFEELTPEFARYLFRGEHVRRRISALAQGATRYNLSKKQFLKLSVFLPSAKEQTAIAKVLATSDKEIRAIKQRIDYLRSEKKALMQQLLTGKRRVNVETEAA